MKVFSSRILFCVLVLATSAFAAEDSMEIVSVSIAQIEADESNLTKNQYISTGQPDSAMLDSVASAGFKTVIDLRTEGENRGIDESAEVEKLGMKYVLLPIAAPDDINYESAKELDRILADTDGPVFLHCASGNRVGALVALRARMNGATADDALLVGKQRA